MKGARLTIGYFILTLAMLAPTTTPAQSDANTGTVFGVITGASGAALTGATIEASNADTGFVRRTVSDSTGFYRIGFLPVGDYDVRASSAGFNTKISRDVPVSLGTSARTDFVLGAATAEVEIVVTAETSVVQTTNSNTSSWVGERQIVGLPHNRLDFVDLALLTPGPVLP